MEPNDVQRFTHDCDQLMQEMESLNRATYEGKGKVGYDENGHVFFSTSFDQMGDKVAAGSSKLLGKHFGGMVGKKVASYAQGIYRQGRHASTKTTLTALDHLRQRIAVHVNKLELDYDHLNPEEKQLVDAKINDLKTVVQKTKNEGIHHLLNLYSIRKGRAGTQSDTARAQDFKYISDHFDQYDSVQSVTIYRDSAERINPQIIAKGEIYQNNLNSIEPPALHRLLVIPTQVAQDCLFDAYQKSHKVAKQDHLEDEAMKQRPFDHAPPLVPQHHDGNATWISKRCLRIDEDFQSQDNQTYGTTERAREKNKAQQHLPNIKVQSDPTIEHLTLTCGVIDSELKADEFLHTVLVELTKRDENSKKIPLRICLHQLNSFGRIEVVGAGVDLGEKKMINAQNQISRYMETKLRDVLTPEFCQAHALHLPTKEDALVTHDNSAFNVASEINAGEDAKNNRLNLEAYAIRLMWGLEEIQHKIDFPAMDVLQSIITHFRSQTIDIKNEIELSESAETRKAKKSELTHLQNDFFVMLNDLRDVLFGVAVVPPDAYAEKIKEFLIDMMKQAVPTKQESMERVRVTEVERNFILDLITGSITEINCKSGLDRTGLARSLWDSMVTLYKDKKAQLAQDPAVQPREIESTARRYIIDLVKNQDRLSDIHDKYMNEFIKLRRMPIKKKLEEHCAPFHGDFKAEYLQYLSTKIPEIVAAAGPGLIERKSEKETMDILKDALHYQNLVAYHLLTVALPITQESTGVVGVKYNHKRDPGAIGAKVGSYSANPHPLHRLPMVVQLESGELVRLVKEGTAMTPACYDLFERLSSLRGG